MPTVAEAGEQTLEMMRSGAARTRRGSHYRPGSIVHYESVLSRHIGPELGDLLLDEVDRARIQRFMSKLLATGLSSSSVISILNPLRLVFRCAVLHGLIEDNPTLGLELPGVEYGPVTVIPPEEAKRRVECLAGRARAAWALAFFAGLRQGELFALRIEDIDLNGGVVEVRRSWDWRLKEMLPPKTRAGERGVPIMGQLRIELERAVAGLPWRRGLVLGSGPDRPCTPNALTGKAHRAWLRHGLGPVNLHAARHSFISYMIAAGIDLKQIQVAAGHASVAFTLDRYGHLLPGHGVSAAAALERFFRDPGSDEIDSRSAADRESALGYRWHGPDGVPRHLREAS